LTLQDRRGGWWIPTGEGVFRFPAGPVSSLSMARPEMTYTRRQGLRSDSILRLLEDSRGGNNCKWRPWAREHAAESVQSWRDGPNRIGSARPRHQHRR
jgi:hypothetical protein